MMNIWGIPQSDLTGGADINPQCYGGLKIIPLSFIPITCLMAWFEGKSLTLGLPIHNFLVIIYIYLPSPEVLPVILLLFFSLAICIVINLLLGVIFERLEGLIESISGASVAQFGAQIGMTKATLGALKGVATGAQDLQEKVFSRERQPKPDSEPKPGGGGGGGSIDADGTPGGGGGSIDAGGSTGSGGSIDAGGSGNTDGSGGGGGSGGSIDASGTGAAGGAADAAASGG
jgi:hypothetical protein